MDTPGDVWIIPFFPIWGYVLHFEHVSCVMNWWPKSVSHHLFSSPNWSLGLAGGKYYQKINIPILRLVLQNFTLQVAFLVFFSIVNFSLYFLAATVRLSVCLSHLFHHVPIIVSSWNFQELSPWSKVMSMQKVKVKGQGHRGQHPT